MVGSALSFVVMSGLARYLGSHTSVAMMIFWRSMAGVLMTLPFVVGKNIGAWKVKRWDKVVLRSFYGTIGFFASFYAYAHLPLAHAQALSFSRALFITILAVVLLKEKVAWRRWSAIVVGFIGVILMTGSGSQKLVDLDLASLAAIAAAFAFALSIITVKDLTSDHSPLTLVLYANILTTIAGIPFLLADFHMPPQSSLLPLALMGVTGVIAQACYVQALSVGEASLMGLMDYLRLPLAVIVGFIAFAEIPNGNSLLGAFIVIASTIYITFREAQLESKKAVEQD
ncbi:MAG: S-adenosylmethionine uptake transporter [Hyphomonadaceae bacterium]|nr:MAG: S-adenosylmethionine uptake transporter [Hyphomonadaceae bacterium]KAF0184673.1 MAG: S-adenosylmethionine uptake transporter [Hyphomonadaceae bacterium]